MNQPYFFIGWFMILSHRQSIAILIPFNTPVIFSIDNISDLCVGTIHYIIGTIQVVPFLVGNLRRGEFHDTTYDGRAIVKLAFTRKAQVSTIRTSGLRQPQSSYGKPALIRRKPLDD